MIKKITRIRLPAVFCMIVLMPHFLSAQSADELLAKGDAFDRCHAHDEALESYFCADKLRPDNAEILWRIARQYAQLMAADKNISKQKVLGAQALAAAERAKELAPSNSQVRLSLAIVYGRVALLESPQRRMEMSRLIKEEAEAALALDSQNSLAWHVLGRWNYEMANLNPLLRAVAQMIFGKLPDASNERAIECFQKSITFGSSLLVNHIELGRAYAASGKKDLARYHLEKGLSIPSLNKDDEEAKTRARKALAHLCTLES